MRWYLFISIALLVFSLITAIALFLFVSRNFEVKPIEESDNNKISPELRAEATD